MTELMTREFNCGKCSRPIFLSFEASKSFGLGPHSETIRCPWEGCGDESHQDLPGKLLKVEKKL